MAALVVQSRFAGLKIEDDDGFQTPQKAKKAKAAAAKKPDPPKKSTKPNATNSVKSQPNSQPKKKKQKATATTSDQWEQWKQKDEQMVDGNFENELQQAIMLSKLDYEEKKDVYKLHKKEAEVEKKTPDPSKSGSKKQKKKNVMSLDQFNSMVSGEDGKGSHEDEKESTTSSKSTDKDTEFFERVKDEARDELIKDQIIDRVKNRKQLSNEVMTRVQFADALEKKNKEIAMLRHEIDSLKEDLLTVKSRNRKLCNILGQGEMKDKAEVLVEVERLRGVQAELTAEVSALHTELERERSKNADPRAKDKLGFKPGTSRMVCRCTTAAPRCRREF